MKGSNIFQATWVMLGSLSSLALSIVSAIILSRYLTKSDYGTYKQVLYVYNTLLIVFSAGLPKVYAYYLPKFNKQKGKDVVLKINTLLFLLGAIFSVLLFLFASQIANVLQNENLEQLLKIFACVPLFLLPTLGIEGIFSSYRKSKFIAIYNVLSRLMLLTCIILPVILFEDKLLGVIYGWCLGSILTFVMALYFKNIPFFRVKKENSGLGHIEILKYAFPIALASLWGIIIKAADQFYVSRFFGTEVFAEFSNGFIELPFVGMVTMSASVVLMPVFSKMIHENKDKEELLNLWKSTLYKSALVIYPIVVFCFFYAKDIMILLYSDKYADSGQYFQINMLLNFFNIIVFAPMLFALGKTKFYARVHMFIAVLIWLLGYIVIMNFDDAIYLAILSVGLSIVKVLLFLFFIAKFLRFRVLELIPLSRISKLIIHSFCCLMFTVIVFNFITIEYIFLDISFKAFLYFSLLMFTAKLFGISYVEILKPFYEKLITKKK